MTSGIYASWLNLTVLFSFEMVAFDSFVVFSELQVRFCSWGINHAPNLLALVPAQLLLCNRLALGFGEFANFTFQLKMPEVA